MKIRNVSKRTENPCSCGTWLKHWEKFSGQRTSFCQAFGCLNKDVEGAHVQKADDDDANWYVFPLCAKHSQIIGDLVVANAFKLVPADPGQTCGASSA
jgi:hypothetical protein